MNFESQLQCYIRGPNRSHLKLIPLSIKPGLPTQPNIPVPKRSTTLTHSVLRTQPTTHTNKESQPSQTTSIAFSRLRSQSYPSVFCSFRPNEYNKSILPVFKVNRMSTLVSDGPFYAARVDQMYLRYVKSLLSLRHARLF